MTHTFKVKFNDTVYSFECFDNDDSKFITSQILSGKNYKKIPYHPPINTIIDIGANVGAFAAISSCTYPNAIIHSFEPAKAPYELLVRNTQQFPQVKTYNIGLFHQSGMSKLYKSKTDSVTASIGRSFLNTQEVEIIQLQSIAEWLTENNVTTIDILKIDTEGCELPILLSIRDRLPQIPIIYCEYHSEMDRLNMDKLLTPTHTLAASHAEYAHLGELTYVRSDVQPGVLHERRIVL